MNSQSNLVRLGWQNERSLYEGSTLKRWKLFMKSVAEKAQPHRDWHLDYQRVPENPNLAKAEYSQHWDLTIHKNVSQ